MRSWWVSFALCSFLLNTSVAVGQSPAPVIFFTDLQSGPNSGGDVQGAYSGAYVTLYGNFFGTAQGTSTVTLNGSSCLRVVDWGSTWMWYQRIVVQLGSTCGSGPLVVRTSAGSSNGIAFTIRSGNIYCVSTAGNDSNSGRFPSSCWSTMAHAVGKALAGDTVYLENGVVNTTMSAYSAVVNFTATPGGTASNPIAFVAYPGATVTIGDYNNSTYAIRVPQTGASPAYYVIAGLTLRGFTAVEEFQGDNWHIVANDMSCPGKGFACVHIDVSTNTYFYGNNVHNVGEQCGGGCKLYHAVYHTTNTNHVWEAWNIVDPDPNHTGVAGCRGIQFYSTSGSDQFDLHVHDNIIRNTICDGLNFATVNPAAGPIEAYNNVIYHAGTGPDPSGQLSNYACIYINSSTTQTAVSEVYNNTLYDCGSRRTGNYGGVSAAIPTRFRNNIIYSLSGEPYLAANSASCSNLSGTNNDWFGNGSAPCSSNITGSLNVNPNFVSTTAGSIDLRLQPNSPMINGGLAIGTLTSDIVGMARPQSGSIDIGAYEVTAFAPPPPTCDLNGDGVVNNTDVQLEVTQVLGACTNGDLDGDGRCDAIDLQRIINASLGSACRIGP